MFELHWLPIRYRVSFKIALIVFKCLNIENFPSYLKDLISIYTPSRTLRSSDSRILNKPVMKLSTFGDKAFCFAAPEVWNDLPSDIRFTNSISIFKKLFITSRPFTPLCLFSFFSQTIAKCKLCWCINFYA